MQPAKPPAGSRSKPTPNTWGLLGMDISRLIREHVFAIAVAAAFIITNFTHWAIVAFLRLQNASNGVGPSLAQMLVRSSLQPHHARTLSAFGQLWYLLSSLVFVGTVPALLLNAVLLLFVIGFAQTFLKVWRTVLVSLLSAVLGTALGLLLFIGINMMLNDWVSTKQLRISLSPFTLVVGALMAASVYQSLLWRRRILLIGYTGICAVLLFSGNPGDYCTLAAAIVGQLAGMLMRGRVEETIHWWRGTDYEIRRLFGASQLVLAIGPILALTSNSHAGPLSRLGLFMAPSLGNASFTGACLNGMTVHDCVSLLGMQRVIRVGLWLGTLITAAAIAVVAWGLSRGRRLAAWTSMALNTATSVFVILYYLVFPLTVNTQVQMLGNQHGLTPGFIATVLPPLLLVILVARNLPHFSIRTNAKLIRLGASAIVAILAVTAVGFVGFGLAAPHTFKPAATIVALFHELPRLYLPIGFAARSVSTIQPATVASSSVTLAVSILFWATVLAVFIMWFRDGVREGGHERAHVERILEYGGESMSFMATWEGNSYWFSPTDRSAIAYRVLHGVALTVTGPFGDPAEYSMVLHEFIRFCEERSWSPAFYAVHESQRRELAEMGCSSIQVGTEMVIIPSQWKTTGKKWQDIRTAINKAKRSGITDVLTTYDAADWRIKQQIVEISEQWSELKALPEMKFTLGGVEELRDPRVALLYAIDAQGEVQGVTSWLPTYREGRHIGWTLDFMRHRTDSPNGIMEFLIARMAERLQAQGESDASQRIEFMSLSAAPLAGLADDSNAAGSAVIKHALQIVASMLEPAYGFKSLYFFKSKFQPVAKPVYVSYLDAGKLPQIALAVTSSYLPELKPAQVLDMFKALKPAKAE